MGDITAADLQKQFQALFGATPRIYRAPGRLNLIGEHTDYNDGFVMPAAIEFYTWIAIAPRENHKLRVYSTNFLESAEIDLEGHQPRPRNHWSDYVLGVAVMLQRAGHRLRGASLLVHGDVPIESGLSSSAAIEVATGFALLEAFGLPVHRVELAKLCQRAENDFVGARCGIMDQFISCCGPASHALLLDCRSLDYHPLPLPGEVSLVICNTVVKHELASGEYNTRRAECEEGVRLLTRFLPQLRALRDVSLQDLKKYSAHLPVTIFKRCRHVVSENARVTEAAAALECSDLSTFARLMHDSHVGLRDDYQVSCAELDLMVELAENFSGVFEARMTGGGFGGCTINLVANQSVAEFQLHVARAYEKSTSLAPRIFATTAAEGVAEVLR